MPSLLLFIDLRLVVVTVPLSIVTKALISLELTGGLWEAAVEATKRHLRRVIGDQILTFVEYSTLLCRIEACLNSRPLCPPSDDVSDLQPLTPAHFLIQRCSFLVPEPDILEDKLTPNRRYDIIS